MVCIEEQFDVIGRHDLCYRRPVLKVSVVELIAIIGVVLGLLSIAATYWFGKSRRRDPAPVPNEPIRSRDSMPGSFVWRAGPFFQALHSFDEFCDHLEAQQTNENSTTATAQTPGSAESPSLSQIEAWAASILLAAATRISPAAQGKANIFVFVDGPLAIRELGSRYLSGTFPLAQIVGPQAQYRDVWVDTNVPLREQAGAARSLVRQRSVTIALRESDFNNVIEEELKTTHILAIPATDDFQTAPIDSLAAMTIDLRFPLLIRRLILAKRSPVRHHLLHRAEFLRLRLRRLEQIIVSARGGQ